LRIANFALEKSSVPAVIAYSERKGNNESSKMALGLASVVQRLLADAGLPLPMVSTGNLTPEFLKTKKLVLLAYVNFMEDKDTAALIDFVKDGGKIIACYKIPDSLATLLGVKMAPTCKIVDDKTTTMRFADKAPENAPSEVKLSCWGFIESTPIIGQGEVIAWWNDPRDQKAKYPAVIVSKNGTWLSEVPRQDIDGNVSRLLISLASQYLPNVWREPAKRKVSQMGCSINKSGWDEAIKEIRALPESNDQSKACLKQAELEAGQVKAALEADNPVQAIKAAEAAEATLNKAYCLAQKSVTPEFRAIGCNYEGEAGYGWEKTAEMFKKDGINNLFMIMLYGASAAYPSKYVPFNTENTEKKDYLAEALAACAKHGIKLHVLIMNYQAGGGHTPRETMEQLRKEGRLVVNDKGETAENLCPANDQNIRLQVDLMLEVARRPGVAGVMFDYIRYPEPNTCFCPNCRQKFSERLGKEISNWPKDVMNGGIYHDDWLQFRRDNITGLVRTVSEKFRKEFPGKQLSAAVWRDLQSCRDQYGQDWGLWVKEGLLDFIGPMDYTIDHDEFRDLVKKQMSIVNGRIPLYPFIGLHRGHSSADFVKQIQITRDLNTGGFGVFQEYYNTSIWRDLRSGALK
jgi:uncharacterized lipoprotein YddW (UPF0748 family)